MSKDTLHLATLERDRANTLREARSILERIGIEVFPMPVEDFQVESHGIRMTPVASVDGFLDSLPTEFLLTERTQFNRILLTVKEAHGVYIMLLEDVRGHFVGFVITDLFFQRASWVFDRLYKARGCAPEIKAVMRRALEPYADEVEGLKMLYENATEA